MITANDKSPQALVIGKILELVKTKQSTAEAKLIEPFIAKFFEHVSAEDLAHREIVDLYGSIVAHWQFFKERPKGENKVRVYNPQFELHGWQSTHTIVEIVADDMPFLVDSVRMEINRRNLNLHFINHISCLSVSRDDNGVVNNFKDNDSNYETPIYIEIDRITDTNALQSLQEKIYAVLSDVTCAVDDWQEMTGRIHEIIEYFKFGVKDKEAKVSNVFPEAKAVIDDAELKESLKFLHWIESGNFTFLGSRYYHLSGALGNETWDVVKGTGLGVLKHDTSVTSKRQLKNMPLEARELVKSKQFLIISKTNTLSTIHRPTYTHSLAIKYFDKSGKVIGQCRFVGLFTSTAYNSSPLSIPLLNLKVNQVLEKSNLPRHSHDGKALINIIETLPREMLFESNYEELYSIAFGILQMQERQKIKLFIRRDVYGRYYSCLVFVPRELFNSELRQKMQDILVQELNGTESYFSTRFSESILARIHFEIRVKPTESYEINVKAIEQKLIDISKIWLDDLKDALIEHFGEEKGNAYFGKYKESFHAGYRESFPVARSAVYDIGHLETLNEDKQLSMSFYKPMEQGDTSLRFKIFKPDNPISLSEVVPMLENMGVKVISEQPYPIKVKASSTKYWINDYAMLYTKGTEFSIDSVKDIFQESFANVFFGNAENDGFNRLVLAAKLNWREIAVFRAYAKYFWQTGFTFSQTYIEDTLFNHADIARDLLKLFNLRFSPDINREEANDACEKVIASINHALEAVESIDEDRILKHYQDAIMATMRTNFYQKDKNGNYKNYISFKFNPKLIPDLPKPLPRHEIFVYSPRMEGVHLRGADVARGGLRWSDRPQDFRTEVLGLMKAQQVKNAVIVPLGAKGGFVPKRLPEAGTREEVMAEVVKSYQTFIRGLLDVTDNLNGEEVIPAKDVVRYDKDDTYLVVAADKGTATFSDIANEISLEYNFWLGDAFASGGSTGYDHKKMGITARGAWECVKRHFREMGHDTQTQDFTVVGIGDMAGDVFGNGMLLSKHIKLLGAYNHRHIFVDPNPDAAASFEERKRLFNLPRSSWSDYNPKLISKGGGVFDRSSKYIMLTPEIRKMLKLEEDRIQPNQLIQALIKMEIDLLWNGGIGTFVKASSERNSDVGDKLNDAIRINAKELNAKVVGEGGNLGFTQLGRIEYCLKGGRINTDALDNSAGVDCSDHEVNIKILLNSIVKEGDLTEKQRNLLLSEMTDEVAQLVLTNTRRQAQAISLGVESAASNSNMHIRLLKELESSGKIDRALEFLPTNDEILERRTNEKGLTRSEMAVLMGYVKTILKESLLKSNVPENEYIAKILTTAFPKVLDEKFHNNLTHHPLRRQIIATQLANAVINDMGINFIQRLNDETGADAPEIASCYVIAKQVFDADGVRAAIASLDHKVDASLQLRMLQELNRLVRRGTRWFLRNQLQLDSISETVNFYAPRVAQVFNSLPNYLSGVPRKSMDKLVAELIEGKVPQELAFKIAGMVPMFSALDIVAATKGLKFTIDEVTKVYFTAGAKLNLGWFREQIKSHPVANHWDAMARASFRDDLDRQQRRLTIGILTTNFEQVVDIEERIEAWLAKFDELVVRWQHMVTEIKATPQKEFLMYAVALRELLDLTRIGGQAYPTEKVDSNNDLKSA